VRPATTRIDIPGVISAGVFASISGRASGTGLTKVQVVVRRADAKAQKKKICFFLNQAGRMQKVKSPVKSCTAPLLVITPSTTNPWTVRVTKPLKPGIYYVSSRAITKTGGSAWLTKVIQVKKK